MTCRRCSSRGNPSRGAAVGEAGCGTAREVDLAARPARAALPVQCSPAGAAGGRPRATRLAFRKAGRSGRRLLPTRANAGKGPSTWLAAPACCTAPRRHGAKRLAAGTVGSSPGQIICGPAVCIRMSCQRLFQVAHCSDFLKPLAEKLESPPRDEPSKPLQSGFQQPYCLLQARAVRQQAVRLGHPGWNRRFPSAALPGRSSVIRRFRSAPCTLLTAIPGRSAVSQLLPEPRHRHGHPWQR